MEKKSNAGLWVALGVGAYVGLWVLAALMGWTTVINILIVLTAASAAAGIAALFMKGRAKRQARKRAREQREQERKEPETKTAAAAKKSYGPEIDPIIQEGNRALSEMGRLYMSI